MSAYRALPPSLGIRLVIVGGMNQTVFADSGDAGSDARILMVGPVSDAQLKALYSAALAFVFHRSTKDSDCPVGGDAVWMPGDRI
jgi:hypothetical protein